MTYYLWRCTYFSNASINESRKLHELLFMTDCYEPEQDKIYVDGYGLVDAVMVCKGNSKEELLSYALNNTQHKEFMYDEV